VTLTVTDLFAGAGGSSTGMRTVDGVEVKIAANHWKVACDVHNLNHPDTDHAVKDLHEEDPRYFPKTDILWASPECTKWSQANGTNLPAIEEGLFEDPESSEAAVRSRLLMFDVLRFIEHHRYRRVIFENVVDIAMQSQYRLAWQVWRQQLLALGYLFRVVSLNSMHAQYAGLPAPQSRDRLYIVCWPKGDLAPDIDKVMRPRAWCPACGVVVEAQQAFKPGRTVGRYRAQYVYVHAACGATVEPGWLPAAAAIDWTLAGTRIGDRAKPLADKTRARIAAGIARYWRPFTLEAAGNTYDAADPSHTAHGRSNAYYRAWPADEVLTTLHTTASKALAVPVEGRDGKRAQAALEPMRTMTTRAETALVTRHYGIPGGNAARHSTPADESLRTLTGNGGNMSITEPPFIAELRGGSSDARPVADPLATVCASGNHHALIEPEPFILERRGDYRTRSIDDPMSTLTANDTTKALLAPYYSSGSGETARSAMDVIGALTTRDRYALVHRHNEGGAEMLTPVSEELRTLTTKGHQSLVTPGDLEAAESMVDDCLFRMLEPNEVAAGMAFPGDYEWQPYTLKAISRRDLVKLAGNAVTPPASRDLMTAVAESLGAVA
jgi:DNA (cytosine-5)-methyltransferase 1